MTREDKWNAVLTVPPQTTTVLMPTVPAIGQGIEIPVVGTVGKRATVKAEIAAAEELPQPKFDALEWEARLNIGLGPGPIEPGSTETHMSIGAAGATKR